MTEEFQIPQQSTHSIKLSETAKGIRIDVHVYATDQQTAIKEALATYLGIRGMCETAKIVIAPMEVETKK